MPADAILCTSCGFNRHTGLRREHKPIPCRECGYDLTGVTNPTCPECNTPIRRGRTSLLDSEREVVWASYRKALMGIGIGLASLVLFIGLMGSFRAVPAGVLGTLICWPAAIIGYAIVKMFWDGIDEPWRLLALRALAALLMAAAAAALLMPGDPMAVYRGGTLARLSVMIVVVVGTLMTACEEDAEDAVAYAIPFAVLGAFGPDVAASIV